MQTPVNCILWVIREFISVLNFHISVSWQFLSGTTSPTMCLNLPRNQRSNHYTKLYWKKNTLFCCYWHCYSCCTLVAIKTAANSCCILALHLIIRNSKFGSSSCDILTLIVCTGFWMEQVQPDALWHWQSTPQDCPGIQVQCMSVCLLSNSDSVCFLTNVYLTTLLCYRVCHVCRCSILISSTSVKLLNTHWYVIVPITVGI